MWSLFTILPKCKFSRMIITKELGSLEHVGLFWTPRFWIDTNNIWVELTDPWVKNWTN